MSKKIISIIIGVVLVVGVGFIVVINKKPAYIPVDTTTPSTPTTTTSSIKMSEVATHGTRTSCWSAINGNVYDLTSWIPEHPGGEQTILSLCGVDGTVGYNGQHGSSKRPLSILGGFKLGSLAK